MFPAFRLPEVHAVIMHPDTAAIVPPVIALLWAMRGAPIETNRYMQQGIILGMGRGTEIIRELRFHQDVEEAMRENAEFLALMKQSGLAG